MHTIPFYLWMMCDDNELERNIRLEKVVAGKELRLAVSDWPWRQKKKEEQVWKMMQLPNGSGWPWRQESKTGEDGSYCTVTMIKGVVDVSMVLLLKPILIKLATTLIIQT